MSILGIVLWWRTRKLDRFAKGAARIHRQTGLVLSVLVLAVASTGTALNLFIAAEKASKVSVTAWNMSQAHTGHAAHGAVPRVDIDTAAQIALAALGRPASVGAFSPVGAHARYYWFAFSDEKLARTDVLVDPDDGHVVGIYPSGVREGGGGVRQWLFPIHSGYIVGPIGGIVMALLGLFPLVWLVTGIMTWRRGRRPNRARPATPALA
jgi:uncharacterized iron-regulated membrane protein